MYEKIKRRVTSFGFIFILCTACFVAGTITGNARADYSYEGRLAVIGKLNASLQSENIELTGLNKDLTERNARNEDRLRQAADTLGELDLRTATNADTIRRLIENLSKLEQAISVIFANGEN